MRRELLRKWIQEGGKYDSHWAFKLLPKEVRVPRAETNADATWSRSPIDEFVLAELQTQKLSPATETERWRWLRRVTFDLTGLPPTPVEIAKFEQDKSDDSYEKAVERLLNSKHFGEHMAVAWLDAARYADSYGYQSDKLNTQWPYRDWVVQAFNDNLAYDKFLTWQLAGDLLPNPTRNQRLATAFNRIHRLNNEGGAVFEEWRVENVSDRVHTFGTAMLGLTLECCRCHDHKYDPISTREYYSISAFFNSIDESGVYDRSQKVPCPSMLLPTPGQANTLTTAKNQLADAKEAYRVSKALAKNRYQQWVKDNAKSLAIPDLQLALGFDQPFDDSLKKLYHPSQSDRAWAPSPELVAVEDCPVPRLANANDAPPKTEDKQAARTAISLDGERGITTTGIPPFDRWTPFSIVVTLREQKRSDLRSLIAHHTRGTDCGYNGWDLTIQDGYLESRMYRVWPGNAIGVRTQKQIPVDGWQQVTATYDGSSTAKGLKLFLDGKPLATEILRDQVKKSANVEVDHGGEFVIGQRFRARGFTDGLIDDVRVYSRDLTETEIAHLATGSKISPTEEYFLAAVDEVTRTLRDKLTSAHESVVMAEEVMNEIPVMAEDAVPRETHVLARGVYDAPKSKETLVGRETFANIPLPLPSEAPRNRLGLARWVTHPNHPLTARVAVNRFWANFFGNPLVGTPENFGLQSNAPTHPRLLDWLARGLCR